MCSCVRHYRLRRFGTSGLDAKSTLSKPDKDQKSPTPVPKS
ncbi:hypothetical protein AVEN_4235-1, partial [Araneus ventricosus]